MSYARWRRLLPTWIDVQPVEWPGRGARMDEPLFTNPHELAAQLASELQVKIDGPYALFGHSLGAVIAFELIHGLLDRGVTAPRMLFASGSEAPAMRDDDRWRLPLSDDALLHELRGLRGTPDEVLSNSEIMQAALPVLRADFLMCGAYAYRKRRPLPCPIHVFGGSDDDTSRGSLEAWSQETAAGFGLDMVPGHHFFIHTQQDEILRLVSTVLSPRTEQPWPVARDHGSGGATRVAS